MKRLFRDAANLIAAITAMSAMSPFSAGIGVTAQESNLLYSGDCGPAIGAFVSDPEMERLIIEKEAAMNHYIETGDITPFKNVGKGQEARIQSSQHESQPQRYFARNLAVTQFPQTTSTYCGYAAIQSILDYNGISKTQPQIASDSVFLGNSACPWYISNGNSISQFPAAVYLKNQTGYAYAPWPYGSAGANPPTELQIKVRVTTAIDADRPILALGTSKGDSSDPSHIDGYPNRDIHHWLVVKGYNENGDSVYIADPAKSSAVSWSSSIYAKYSITTEKLTAFVAPKGIIW